MLTTVHRATDVRIMKEARALAEAGHDVVIVGPHGQAEKVGSIRFHPIPMWTRRSQRLAAAWKCFSEAKKLGADAYHFHDPELLPIGWLLRQQTRAKVIYDCHEYLELDIRQKPWIPALLRNPIARIAGWLEFMLARRLDGVVSVLEDMSERFARGNVFTATVHNYAAMPALEGLSRPALAEESIVYVGLIHEKRGFNTMVHALRILQEMRPDLKCYAVGAFAGHCLPDNLPSNLVLVGQVPYDQALSYMKFATLGWIPFDRTVYYERALPIKLFEYMAAGLPVVASDLGLMAQIVSDASAGLLAAPGDPASHADAIVALLEDKGLRDRCSADGKNTFLKRYNWTAEKEILIDFYARLFGTVRH